MVTRRRRLGGFLLGLILAAIWVGLIWWGLILLSEPMDHHPTGIVYDSMLTDERTEQ